MERNSHTIKCQKTYYKQFTKAEFLGFSRDYPPSLRSILSPEEFESIIRNINLNATKTKKTTGLRVASIFGQVLWIFFIGVPIFLGCLIADRIIFKSFFKKISKNINNILFQVNQSAVCVSRSIQFSLLSFAKPDGAYDFNIVVSFLRSGIRESTLLLNPQPQNNNISTNTTIVNNYHNNTNNTNNNSSNLNNNEKANIINGFSENSKYSISDLPIDK